MKFFSFLVLSSFFIFVAGCQSTETELEASSSAVPEVEIPVAENVVEAPAETPLEGTTWRLVEVMGEAVAAPAEGQKPFTLMLESSTKRLSAYAGCNAIGGEYLIKLPSQIKGEHIIQTEMGCTEMKIEDRLITVLQTMDSFSIKENRLVLMRAKMAPLARFVAE